MDTEIMKPPPAQSQTPTRSRPQRKTSPTAASSPPAFDQWRIKPTAKHNYKNLQVPFNNANIQERANTATCETVTFTRQTKIKKTATLRHHKGNQSVQRSNNHNNKMKEALQRLDTHTRNNQPWIEIKGTSKQRHRPSASQLPAKSGFSHSFLDAKWVAPSQ
jgi:hypothetical protein